MTAMLFGKSYSALKSLLTEKQTKRYPDTSEMMQFRYLPPPADDSILDRRAGDECGDYQSWTSRSNSSFELGLGRQVSAPYRQF